MGLTRQLEKNVWIGKYYSIAYKGSLDSNHPGMKLLFSLSKKHARVLDMGCGEGTRLNLVASKAKRAVGVDISKDAIALAKSKYPHMQFHVANLEKLPLENNSFDLVYSAFTFEHLVNPREVIAEAMRVLASRGKLVIIAPNYGAPNRASPPFKGSRIKKFLIGFFRDFLPAEGLNWGKVKPFTKGYKPDWDTVIEPYISSLVKYLREQNIDVFYKDSCWDRELPVAKIHQTLFKFLGKQGIYPFSMWGPHLVVGAKKQESCYLCGKEKLSTLFTVRGRNIERCSCCGLVRTENFTFPDYHRYHRDKEYQKSKKLFENIFLKRIKTVEKFKKTGKVLEIGCSIGTLLGLFKDRGREVWGVEPSKSAAVAAKRGVKVINKFFRDADLPKNYFDVVVLNHTLEHLTDPLGVLTKAKSLLKNGGIIFVDVPNFGSLSSRVFGKYWPYLAPEEHIWHFTPKTLKKLLKKAKFRVIHWEANSGIFDWGSPVKGLFDKLVGLRKSFFVDFVTVPLAFVNTKMRIGTSLTVIGQK